jgi:3',5'-cyclic AMP phosphodiesterase CpdA
MIFRKQISSVLLFFLLTGLGRAQKPDTTASFFIIQVTDPQFGMFESNKGLMKETELYKKAVLAINRLNPDFVVLTGDLVNNKDDLSQKTVFKRITSEIHTTIPVYYSPGNHDIGLPPTQEDIDSFISDYGHDRFSVKHKGSLFIGLNSCLIKSLDSVPEHKQFEWLKEELSQNKNAKHIVVFCHYPFFIESVDEPENYSNISIIIRKKYLSLFKEYKVKAVFAGHLHKNAMAKYEGIDIIATSALGKPLGDASSGFRVIKVFSDRIESKYYPIDEIPARIESEEKQQVLQ